MPGMERRSQGTGLEFSTPGRSAKGDWLVMGLAGKGSQESGGAGRRGWKGRWASGHAHGSGSEEERGMP